MYNSFNNSLIFKNSKCNIELCNDKIIMVIYFREDPGSGNLITFLQFLFISLEGFLFTSKCGTVKPNIGIKDYFILVTMFFIANVCNNCAFDFNIPMPLHMIFRAVSMRIQFCTYKIITY